jgi:Spy/CpxP family protein refolding chaperone
MERQASQGVAVMKKISVVLAAATVATALATFAPCGWSQASGASRLPPQLQTDAQRKATRAARAVAAQGSAQSPPAENSAAAALGTALLADVADAAAASAHDDAMHSSRGPEPAAGRRGAPDSPRETWSGDPPGLRQGGDPR